MKRCLPMQSNARLLLVLAVCLWIGSTPGGAQSTIWEVLPFPDDSNWPGSHGQPATTNGNVVTLDGRSVRTVQSFSGPLSISFDVFLQAKNANDGSLDLSFRQPGVASNLTPPSLKLKMEYVKFGSDDLVITGTNSTVVWGPNSFSLSAQTVYHCAVGVSADGVLTWAINNVTNSIPSTVKVPYASYQIGLTGWQPDNVWQVSNFAIVPEPATAVLVAFGLGLLTVIRRRKSP
jgi:hypothetical protein